MLPYQMFLQNATLGAESGEMRLREEPKRNTELHLMGGEFVIQEPFYSGLAQNTSGLCVQIGLYSRVLGITS